MATKLPVPVPPPLPPLPQIFSLPKELTEEDEYSEKRRQKELQFRVVAAIEDVDADLVNKLIEAGLNTNATILLVKTPLTHALEQYEPSLHHQTRSYFHVISALIAAERTDINLAEKTPWGKCPLHYAVTSGSVEFVKLFLCGVKSQECDVNVGDKGQATPLHYAAHAGNLEITKLLLEHGSDVHARDDCGRTALHRAFEERRHSVATHLIKHGISINVTDNFLWTPLFYAVFFREDRTIDYLIRQGASVDSVDIYGNSLLHSLCLNKRTRFIQHPKQHPEDIVLRTSFRYYDRKRKVPSDRFHRFVSRRDEMHEDSPVFNCVHILLNAGVDPKVYGTDDINGLDLTSSVSATICAYLSLAGATLPHDDVFLYINSGLEHQQPSASETLRAEWFTNQRQQQLSLQHQCRYRIRRCLAQTRDLQASINKLLIPGRLKAYLQLEEDFERFLSIMDYPRPFSLQPVNHSDDDDNLSL